MTSRRPWRVLRTRTSRVATLLGLAASLLFVSASSTKSTATAAVPGFTVSGSQILDPSGAAFVPVGYNLTGPHYLSPQASVGSTDAMKAWGFNTARIITCSNPGCNGLSGLPGAQENSDLDAIVRDITSRKGVGMIESYQLLSGSWPTPAQLLSLGNWWAGMAAKYKDNPYVWFNLVNEPGENPTYGSGPADQQWLDMHDYLIGRIRAAGALNPVVVDGSNYGQDIQYTTAGGVLADPTRSAIITFGPALVAKYTNVVFDLHTYEVWGRGTAAQNDARLNDYIGRVKAFGGAIIIGEAGFSENGLEPNAADINAAGSAVFRVAAQQKIGVMAFAIPNSNFPGTITPTDQPYTLTYGSIGDANQINSATAPTNLSKLGALVWNYSKSIAAAVPGNAQMTAPVVGTAVSSQTFDTAIPTTMTAQAGTTLALVPGNPTQALSISGARSPGITFNAASILTVGKTYAFSVQTKSLSTPDSIHVQFIGGDNSAWTTLPDGATTGWAWATVNNNSTTAWTTTNFVVTIPTGFTGNVNFTTNGNTNWALDNLTITDVSAGIPVIPTTTPPPSTTVAPSTVKGFTTVGNQIYDPAGGVFVPVGYNVTGPHYTAQQASVGQTDPMKAFGFNTARIKTCPNPGCNGLSGTGSAENSDLDAIVRDVTSRKGVAMIESYQLLSGSWPNAGQLVGLGDWWAGIAAKYKDNPYVWFNLVNEPGENPTYGSGPADKQWLDMHDYLIGRVRAAGALNPVVIDGSNYGQDIQYTTAGGVLADPTRSAIITFGPALVAKYTNVVFDLHVYEVWGRGTPAQNDARLNDYIGRVKAFGGAMIIGETGFSENGAEPNAVDIKAAVQSAYRVATQQKMGMLAFAVPNSNFPASIPAAFQPYTLTYGTIGDANQINSATAPTNLSQFGTVVYNYSKAIAAAVPGNLQLTAPLVGTPVYTQTFDTAVPPSMGAYTGTTLSLIPGNGTQALLVTGATSPGFTFNTTGILTPGRTYAVSMQTKSLSTPDPIHAQFIGGDNSLWHIQADGNTLGWAWATINNNSTTAWTTTSFVVTIPVGYTGNLNLTTNGNTNWALDNISITDVSAGVVLPPTTVPPVTTAPPTTAPATTVPPVTTVPPTTAPATTAPPTTAPATTAPATTAPPTTVPASTATIVYGDSILWDNWSWSTTLNPAATTPVKVGTNALAVTYNASGAGASFRKPTPLTPVAGQGISFWAYGAVGGNTIDVLTLSTDTGGVSGTKRIQVPAGVWTQLTATWAELGNPTTVARINIVDGKNAAQPTFYIDDLKVGVLPGVVPPTTVATTVAPTTLPPTTVAPTTVAPTTVPPTTTPPTTVPAAGTLIYGDTLAWDNWSWGTTRNNSATTPVKVGLNSMTVTFTAANAAASFRTATPLTTAAGQAIRFWAYGGTGGTKLAVFIHQADATGASVSKNVTVPAGVWTLVTIPLTDLGNPAKIARVNIANGATAAQPIFYIDDLRVS